MSASRKSIVDLFLHIHPKTVAVETIKFSLSLGLGGMGVVLVGLLFFSGMLLLLAYQPSTEHAYSSIIQLTREVPFGVWIRNIHYWSGHLLVIVAMLHLLRVLLTGAFGPGRRLNWVIGLVLLALLLFSNFTGYLLPWDQLSYWAVTICTSMLGYVPFLGTFLLELFRGGTEIGEATLANFFVLHVAVLPASIVLLLFYHFWLVRRAGGLVRREQQDTRPERVVTVPNLVVREAAVGLTLVAIVLLFGIFFNAPLLEQANPGMSPNPVKAPWYFMGFQELLMHLHPTFAVFVWPVITIIILFAVPFWPNANLEPGVWFGGTRARSLALWAITLGCLLTFSLVLADDWILSSSLTTNYSLVITRGLLPTITVALLITSLYLLSVKLSGYSRAEMVMAGIILGITVLGCCTIIGIWFRGEEMALIWPWALDALPH